MMYEEWSSERHRLEMLQCDTRIKLRELNDHRPEKPPLKPEPVPPGDLTWEEAKSIIADDGIIEEWLTDGWVMVGPKRSDLAQHLPENRPYRRNPATKRAPLGPEDVPPGSVVRLLGATTTWCIVLEVDRWSITAFTRAATVLDFLKLQGAYEISRDGGKTWQPCSKEVEV